MAIRYATSVEARRLIEETAKVVAVSGEFAWVETRRQSACGSCAANKGCGTAAIGKILGRRRTTVRAINRAAAEVGETVVVGIGEDSLVRGSLAVYAVPLLALMAAALAGQMLAQAWGWDRDGTAMLFGFTGLGIGLLWLRRFSARISADSRYQPVILRRIIANDATISV